MIKHIVLWTLKNEYKGKSKPELVVEVKSQLESLKNDIIEIKRLEVGINNTQALDSNYDICLLIDFESIDDLKIYQTHPAHVAFKDFVKTVREEKVSIDFNY